jgi:hypothetical protein
MKLKHHNNELNLNWDSNWNKKRKRKIIQIMKTIWNEKHDDKNDDKKEIKPISNTLLYENIDALENDFSWVYKHQ